MIDFTLSPTQTAVLGKIASISSKFLSTASKTYSKHQTPDSRFRALRPFYTQLAQAGLIKGLIPSRFGGTGGSLIDAAIMAEAMIKVDRSLSLTLFATIGGLGPLLYAGDAAQRERFLEPFLSGEGEPLAALVWSEPEGTANYAEKGGKGLQTVARKEGDKWVINGEKMWATNCSGWDDRGADLQCVVCRLSQDSSPQDPNSDPSAAVMILAVSRDDIKANQADAYQIVKHIETPGFSSTVGPHIKFNDFYVPAFNLLAAPGQGANLVTRCMQSSAAFVGAMSAGIMAAAFEAALQFAKSDTRGGTKVILERQGVSDRLMDVKMRTDAARFLTWKACHALENGLGPELALEAKIYCSDLAVKSIVDLMGAVGVSSYNTETIFPELLQDAMLLPLSSGGNVGVRRRQLERIFMADDYQPWAVTYGQT